jgi:NitT/TauT family transport system substrate-binding protein
MGARRHRAALAAGILLAAMALIGCGEDDEGAAGEGGQTDVVRVGVLPTSGIAPLYLGRDRGIFEKQRIELELKVAAGGAAIIPAVVSGDLDIGYGASVSSAIAKAKGLPIKIVAEGTIGAKEERNSINKIVVSRSSDIRSPQDLEGKTIAVNTLGSVAEIGIKASLEELGVNISKVKLLEIELPDMPAALKKRRVDAIWATEPFLSRLEAEGERPLYAWDVEFAPGASLASYFTSEKVLQADKPVVDRFIDAVNESLTYAQAHPDEARAAIRTYLDIPAEAVESMTLPIWEPELQATTIDRQAEYAVKYGIIERKPDTSELIYQR